MEEINWESMVDRRVLTRVTETYRRDDMDKVSIYLREIQVRRYTNDGEQIQFHKPHNKGEVEWGDVIGNCIRVGLRDGGVQTHEFIADVTAEDE